MNSITIVALVLGVMTSLVLSSPVKSKICVPGDNCKLPDCRCAQDPERPGNFSNAKTPQMILLSFDFAFNKATVGPYLNIFKGLKNPNGCDAKGTFFVQSFNSQPETLAELHKNKHELAINSEKGVIPTNAEEWDESLDKVTQLLKSAGIPVEDVQGMRSPQLYMGGNDQLGSLQKHKMSYDSSCVTIDNSKPKTLLWPYTYDFVASLPKCSTGHATNKTFPGVWEFPVPVFHTEGGAYCPTPSGCQPHVNTSDKVFSLFYEAFDNHYYNHRSPFVMDIDPLWLTEKNQVLGTTQFLQLVGAYPDTWILTMSQALKWIQNPAPMTKEIDFKPWDC